MISINSLNIKYNFLYKISMKLQKAQKITKGFYKFVFYDNLKIEENFK